VLTAYANYSPEWCTTGSEINEFLNSLTNLADTSVNMYFKVIKSTCAYMNKTFNLPDPSGKAEIPKVERKRRRYFTSEELLKIINSCQTEFDKTLVLTLIDSTCRIGELASLTVNNIGDSWLDLQGKTGQRRYRCDAFICEKLIKLAGDKKFVFIDKSHKQMKVNALARHVRMVIKAAGITGSKLGPHTLRHSGASLVAQNTGSVLMVKALLQHDNINTSMVYIHDAEDKLRQRISPLQIMSDETKSSNMTQLALAPGETETPQPPADGIRIIDLLELEFK
jgi:integrase